MKVTNSKSHKPKRKEPIAAEIMDLWVEVMFYLTCKVENEKLINHDFVDGVLFLYFQTSLYMD